MTKDVEVVWFWSFYMAYDLSLEAFLFCLPCCMSCHSATMIIITRFGKDIGDFVLFVISFHKYNLRRCFPYSFFWCYLLTLINTFGFSGHFLGKLIRILTCSDCDEYVYMWNISI